MARPFAPHIITDDSVLGGKEIERSLRIDNGDGAHLTRTPSSAGNQKKWTFSCWIKRSNLGGDVDAYDAGEMRIFGGDANASHIFITTGDNLRWDLSPEGSGSASASLTTNRKMRDHINWFHLVCALDTDESNANNRMRMYVNGVEETSFDTRNNPSSGLSNNAINAASLHTLGRRTSAQGSDGMRFDGYMAEINFIDGQQYDASYFGYTDSLTGTWRPKRYEGTYGTNGFHLDYSDTTSTTTLGYDKSGNSNHWALVNFVKQDAVHDSPTNNFATWRVQGPPFHSTATKFQRGNLEIETGTSGGGGSLARTPISSYVVNSGKWYCETWNIATYSMASIAPVQTMVARSNDNTRKIMVFSSDGKFYDYRNASSDSSPSTYAASWTNGDVIGMLIDMDQSTPVAYFSKNGQWANGSGAWNQSDPYTSGGGIPMTGDMLNHTDNDRGFQGYVGFSWSSAGGGTNAKWMTNFGQDGSFANRTGAVGQYQDSAGIGNFRYQVPSGALALCSKNLTRISKKTASKVINPKRHVDCLLYTGDDTTGRSITGLQFQPDFVWVKNRSEAFSSALLDSVRGGNKRLRSDSNAVEDASTDSISSFNSNGWTMGDNDAVNKNGNNYVAWCWKAGGAAVSNSDGTITSQVSANQEAGFSVVTYTGSGADASVGHGLGTKPQVLWVKNLDAADSWKVWFKGVTTDDSYSWQLDTNGANYSGSDKWYNSPNGNDTTTTTFGVSNDGATNRSGEDFVAYCFSARKGYSAFGTYKGNGNVDGRHIYTGFRPRIIIVKRFSNTDDWQIWDSVRDPHNLGHYRLFPSTAAVEGTNVNSNSSQLDIYGDGFKWRGTSNDTNGDGDSYVYMCWAEELSTIPYFSVPTAR